MAVLIAPEYLRATLEREWGIAACDLSPADTGYRHRSFFVREGQTEYCLRVYRDGTTTNALARELEIQKMLAANTLSFATPLAIPTRLGRDIALIETVAGERFAMLTRRLAGSHIPTASVVTASVAGAALAQLDRVFERLPMPRECRCSWPVIADSPAGTVPIIDCAALPHQLIYRDLWYGNVLMQECQFVALLDFELCEVRPRALDFTIGLYNYALRHWTDDATGLSLTRAFATGYARSVELSRAEREAVPSLLVAHLAGLVAIAEADPTALPGSVHDRVADLGWARQWAERSGRDLVSVLCGIFTQRD